MSDEQEMQKQDGFEQALTHALKRVEVRAELTEKILALATEAEQQQRLQAGGGPRLVRLSNGGRVITMPRPQAWWGAVAATLLVTAALGGGVYKQHERAKREMATQQFELSQQVTEQALEQTRQRLREAGVSLE